MAQHEILAAGSDLLKCGLDLGVVMLARLLRR
jgi:hypothetical protein